jgi:hypothetical protein
VVEYLHSKCKVLRSKHIITRKKEREGGREERRKEGKKEGEKKKVRAFHYYMK